MAARRRNYPGAEIYLEVKFRRPGLQFCGFEGLSGEKIWENLEKTCQEIWQRRGNYLKSASRQKRQKAPHGAFCTIS